MEGWKRIGRAVFVGLFAIQKYFALTEQNFGGFPWRRSRMKRAAYALLGCGNYAPTAFGTSFPRGGFLYGKCGWYADAYD